MTVSEPDIQHVIDNILRREGGTSNDPNDRGGETHFGITQPFAQTWNIPWPPTQQDARNGYRRMLAVTKIDQISDAATLDLVADCAVNHGAGKAIRWLQQAIGLFGNDVDGIIGKDTIVSMTGTRSTDWGKTWWPTVFRTILASRLKFYAAIVQNDPSQVKFLGGWINRACEFLA